MTMKFISNSHIARTYYLRNILIYDHNTSNDNIREVGVMCSTELSSHNIPSKDFGRLLLMYWFNSAYYSKYIICSSIVKLWQMELMTSITLLVSLDIWLNTILFRELFITVVAHWTADLQVLGSIPTCVYGIFHPSFISIPEELLVGHMSKRDQRRR